MHGLRFVLVGCVGLGLVPSLLASMDEDPEAQALRKRFEEMKITGTYLDDRLDGKTTGPITGPIAFGPGVQAPGEPDDQAAQFPEDRVEAQYIYYGPWVPRRGHLSLDFRLDERPRDYHFLTLFSIGTGGNTCMTMRLGLDRVVTATSLTKREPVTVFSDPVTLGKWHHVDYWYGPEGSLLLVDGAIEDYSTDWSVPYAHNDSNAFYLGDQPWWDGSSRKAVFDVRYDRTG